jgi:hypothetical protein
MMFLSARRSDATLLEVLAARARSSSARRLAVDCIVGAVIAAAVLRRDSALKIVMTSAAVCLVAYGAWGLVDRAVAMSATKTGTRAATALKVLRALIAVCGVLAAVGVLLGVWALALGTWIS